MTTATLALVAISEESAALITKTLPAINVCELSHHEANELISALDKGQRAIREIKQRFEMLPPH